MPELPEVETVLRGLAPVMMGQRIQRIDIYRRDLRTPVPENFAEGLAGQKVARLIRRGKYILAFMENGEGFFLHLGMSGRVKIRSGSPAASKEKRGAHDHVTFTMADKTKIIFSDPRRFGSLVRISENWAMEKPFSLMGPEPLDVEFGADTLRKKFQGKKTPVKNILLDQGVVAGIGNIYACEALFHARINPAKKAGEIGGKKLTDLVRAIRHVLGIAIEAGGSTLRDHRKTDGSMGYFQHNFSVYDREGKACPGCNCDIARTGGIRRITQAGRSTFYCPWKQK
jgi:formamidopyrimidine-DNA glycosylase